MNFSEIAATTPLLATLQLLPLLTGLVLIRVRGNAAVALAGHYGTGTDVSGDEPVPRNLMSTSLLG